MRMMPLVWEATKRYIEFWIKMLKMKESRLIKWVVVEEAMQVEKKSDWQKDLEKSLVELG